MSTVADLKAIVAEARPLVEQALDLTEQFAALRDAASEKGLDWSQIKALVKASVQDERDGGDGKRVGRIIEKADFASAYADMLGLKMNENNFSAEHDAAPRPEQPRPAPIKPRTPDAPRRAVAHDDGLDLPGFLDRRQPQVVQ